MGLEIKRIFRNGRFQYVEEEESTGGAGPTEGVATAYYNAAEDDPADSFDVLAGDVWICSDEFGPPVQIYIRSADNTTWIQQPGLISVTDGSTTVSAISALVFPGASLQNPGNGIAEVALGGSQPLQLLGPFAVNFDDPNVGTTGTVLTPLDEDTVVVSGFFVPTTSWVTSGSDPISFYITTAQDDGSSDQALTYYEGVASAYAANLEPPLGAGGSKTAAIVAADRNLAFEAYPDAGTFTAGVAAVYALVLTP